MPLEPIKKVFLDKMLEEMPYDRQRQINLTSLVKRYNEAIYELGELKRNSEWKLILEPDAFKLAEQKLISAGKDLRSGQVLDSKSSSWVKHMQEYDQIVEKLKEPKIDETIKEKFCSYFKEPNQKKKADEFIDAYNKKLEALEQEREEWKQKKDKNGDPLYDPIMEAEVEKQLKIVQAHVIQAMQATTAAEKARKLSLAKEALAGVGLTLAGAGLGMIIGGAGGSVVPVWGTITAGIVGGIAGGIYGGIRAYRGYEIAKAKLQERVDRVLGVITEYSSLNTSTHMNPGIAQLKSPETFAWLFGGPRGADYQRMHKKYTKPGEKLEESFKKPMDIMLQSKFAETRGAYFLMLEDMIRENAADAALQVAAGLTPASPFDPYTAILISSQFTIMCTAQIGTARAMANLEPLEGMPSGHIPVDNNKDLLHKAAAGLASNAECLISLAHQINISTNIEHEIKTEMLADVHVALTYTIETYNELVTKHNLPLQKDLVEALKTGISADIKNKGLKITVDNEEITASDNQSKQEKKIYSSGAATLKYLRSDALNMFSSSFHHLKPSQLMDRPHLEKALEGADYFMNVTVGPALGIYAIGTTTFSPYVLNPEAPSTVELGQSGTTVPGLATGITLGVLALACGVGSAMCGIKAEKESAKICLLGDVAERRRVIHSKLHHPERGSAALMQRTDDELRNLLDNPKQQLLLLKTQSVGLAVQSESAYKAQELSRAERTSHLRNVGMWKGKKHESHRPITPGRQKHILDVMNSGLKCLSDLPKKMQREIDAFDKKHPKTYRQEKHKEKIKKLYEEAANHIELMAKIVDSLHGLPDGTDPELINKLNDVLFQLLSLEEYTRKKYPPHVVDVYLEEQESQYKNKPSVDDFKIMEFYDLIEEFKVNIPEGPKDLRGEAMDKLGL
ncbi:Uncharacterised protein [Legionella steigerwaltii]|uniref:Uncharacterized protein n=1 Tax=Legionella steigerwaltii TaxID=460 RepID=A0A378L9V8_9GAMM|nr:hypothetical protein [Legionella steigerwaltii]KTD80838.1 hypothetical protein Lstg_0065 [Legionella steigerwaltii]STY23474.1 Uncharacterised protein [Legionella steigerwaltii]